MKKSVGKILQVVEMIINACLLPLFHVKIFHEVVLLPVETETGESILQRVDLYESIMDTMKYDPLCLVYLSNGVIAISIFYTLLSFVLKNKKLTCAAHIFSVCSIAFFLFVLFAACLVQRYF